jgi:BirA family biotin operon repressor/biotin-[acetyl-CoA-carboxylase] ligase
MPLRLFPETKVDLIIPDQVRNGLPAQGLVQEIVYVPRVGSTNDIARDRARAGAKEGLLVLTEEQLTGRGRHGRRWEAPFGSSLLVSLLLRPTFLPPERAFLLTVLACLAIDRAISRQTGLQLEIKWPNDLLLDGRKVCGILVELEGKAGQLDWAVLAWGLNVNVDVSPHEELAETATSLALKLGRPLARLPLLWACLEEVEILYEALKAGQGERLWSTWRSRLSTLGQTVQVATPEETFTGQALDVTPDGSLLVRRDDGTTVQVVAGDVSIR